MKKKIKVTTVFGTRPEAIKMAPVVKELKKRENIQCDVIVTGQHRDMLDSVLNIFDIIPDYDLNLMKDNQKITDTLSASIKGVSDILSNTNPDLVLVHGDTTTTLGAGLSAFNLRIKLGHVEAGLRTNNIHSPFPEESNRVLTGKLADLHFCATEKNKENLIKEDIKENIYITGNTQIDALLSVIDKDYKFENEFLNSIDFEKNKVIVLTAHRRENQGKPHREIFKAIKRLVQEDKNLIVIYPVHPNPNVLKVANEELSNIENVHLIEPLDYVPFANLLSKAYLLMSDSGGIQEEAPALNKPLLVLRKDTERPEAISSGVALLSGYMQMQVYKDAKSLLYDKILYEQMSKSISPFGDGTSSIQIVDAIEEYFSNK